MEKIANDIFRRNECNDKETARSGISEPPPPKKKYLVEGTNTVCTDMFRKLSGLLRLFHLVPRLTEGHNYCSAVTRWLFKTWV